MNRTIDLLIFLLILIVTLGAPLFLLPLTPEPFETAKFALLLGATIAGYLLWALKMIIEKKLVYTRTPLDLPVFALVVLFFVSSVVSVDQFVSLTGAYPLPWPSFFAMITLAAFYFLVASNIRTRRQITILLWALVASTALASSRSISSYFGIYLPFEFAKYRAFNPLGSTNRLALLVAMILPLSLYFAFFSKRFVKPLATLTSLVMIFTLVLANFWPSYLALVAALGLLIWQLRDRWLKADRLTALIVVDFALLVLALRYIPQINSRLLYNWITDKDQNTPVQNVLDTREPTLPQKYGWQIATQTLGKNPFLGTGPATFLSDFTRLKPRELNATNFWSLRFYRSSSDFTEFIATLGIFGMIAYLAVVVTALRLIARLLAKGPARPDSLAGGEHYLLASLITVSYIAAGLFATSSLATTIVFFVVLAALTALAKINDEPHVEEVTLEFTSKKSFFPAFAFLAATLIFTALSLRYEIKSYKAEYYLQRASQISKTGDAAQTLNYLQKAMVANPSVDAYHRDVAAFALNAAITLNKKGDLTDAEKQTLTQLIQTAIEQGKIASGYQIPTKFPGSSTVNVTNWEILASVYENIVGSAGGTETHATNTLSSALALDPENPVLHDRLGLLFRRLNNLDSAQRKFEDSTIVKGDFGPGHYHLAQVLIEKKSNPTRIVSELNLAKQFLPANDPALPDIDKNLETYTKEVEELQKQQTTPAGSQPQAPLAPSAAPSTSLGR